MSRPFEAARRRFEMMQTLDGPYFSRIRPDAAQRQWFGRSQIQFGFAVREWPRALSYLAARIPDSARRWAVVLNLLDEHAGGDPTGFHTATFETFLRRLGIAEAELHRAQPGAAVGAFNSALVGLCLHEPIALAAAAAGMIELMFASISEQLADQVVAAGWIAREQLIHYDLHAALDVEHAEALFAIADADWRTAEGRRLVQRGIDLGGHLFDQLYRQLAVEGGSRQARCA